MEQTTELTENEIDFTRINNDTNGNPRYVCHFYAFVNDTDRAKALKDQHSGLNSSFINALYSLAVTRAHKIGGRKFHNKQYGGGIVFQSYSLPELTRSINELLKQY